VRKLCQFGFSDGEECPEVAVANIGDRWYCAEHYDSWIGYYRRRLLEGDPTLNPNKFDDEGFKETKRVLK